MRLKLTHACTARAPAALVLALGVLAACDSRRSGPVALPTGARTVTYQDSIKLGLVQAHPSVAVTVGKGVALSAADPGAVSIVSLTPSNHQGYDQPATIVGITSGPVGKVTVVGSGAIFCSGSYGTLIGYDSSGTVLGQTPLTLIAPDDCSPPSWPDDVTFGAQATLMVTTGVIAKFEITAMSPLSGPVFRPPDGTYITGNFYQNYSIAVEPAPTPCDSTRNPILADSGVRAVMANALAAGMTDTTYGKRREHGGAIYKFADGHYEAREFLAPDATDCELGDLAISEIVGAVMVAEWHTHPYKVGEKVPQVRDREVQQAQGGGGR